ncbi:unnamed protein product [Effrenium voratum]|nr:unnamed protein product [Effrenium voratum]
MAMETTHSLDDGTDAVVEPPFDEFDLWAHQADDTPQDKRPGRTAMDAPVAQRASGALIAKVQKSFLDQLYADCDVNAAAAKALLSLAKASEGSSESASTVDSSPVPDMPGEQYVAIFDEDEPQDLDQELDEFDMLAQRSGRFEFLPEDRKRAISAVQVAFLDALGSEDANGAAAKALKKLLPSASRSQQAQLFRALFQEKLLQLSGDPNAAAACALRCMAGGGPSA